MKKIKSLLLICMAALMMLAIPLAAACKVDEEPQQPTVESIRLNIDNAMVLYYLGESYSSEGVEVFATIKNPNGEVEESNVTDSAVFDSSAFNNKVAGRYVINVSYELEGSSKAASYEVSVSKEKNEGLLVTHSDGSRVKTINIDADYPRVTIDPSDIVVSKIERERVTGKVTDYNLEVYKEEEKITDYTNLGSGTYQIWVSKESSTTPGFMLEDFVLIYVVEDITSFNWVSGKTIQNIGIDIMTQTWEYEVTYATSSTPVKLTSENVTVTGINVLSAGTRTATASYVYYKANGEKVTLNTNINYEVEKGENQEIVSCNFSWASISGHENNDPLTQEDFNTTRNSFLTKLPAGIVNYRTKAGNADDCIDVKGDALLVTFKGVGTITIGARSQGTSNLSSIGLKKDLGDNKFEYIAGTFTSSDVQQLDYVEGPMYQVTGKDFSSITFVIEEAGQYIICTNDETPEGDATYDRATRVQSIEMTDIYDKVASTSIADGTSIVKAVGKISKANLYNKGSKD